MQVSIFRMSVIITFHTLLEIWKIDFVLLYIYFYVNVKTVGTSRQYPQVDESLYSPHFSA